MGNRGRSRRSAFLFFRTHLWESARLTGRFRTQGVIVLVAIIFVVYRCSSRRFSSLDDEGDAIRWPELNPDGQTISAQASTLNPLGTRRTGRAGVEMSEIDGSEWGGDRGDISAEAAAEYHPNGQSAYDRVPFSDTPTDAGNRASYQCALSFSSASGAEV